MTIDGAMNRLEIMQHNFSKNNNNKFKIRRFYSTTYFLNVYSDMNKILIDVNHKEKYDILCELHYHIYSGTLYFSSPYPT